MKYKDEMEVMFWHGTNRDGVTATHQSSLRVEIVSPPTEHGLARISIEHTREDSLYDGEMFVLTVEEIVPKLLKPLLDVCIEDQKPEDIRKVVESIAYVFEHMLESDED